MKQNALTEAVMSLAAQTHAFSDADLEQPWAWGPHDEGARFALIGTYHELRDLAVKLGMLRREKGTAATAVYHLLAQNNTAYRDLQAVLLGIPHDLYETPPAPGEWPLRSVVGHIIGSQRHFFTLVDYAIRRLRQDPTRSPQLPPNETDKVVGPTSAYMQLVEEGTIADLLTFYDGLHQRMMDEFVTISDTELDSISLWWEEIVFDLHHRLHRFDAHLRQHTIQAEKTLAQLGQPPTEARQLLRLVYNALAEVEGVLIGAPDLGTAQQAELAATITARATAVSTRIAQARQLITAVQAGDLDSVQQLLAAEPLLANARNQAGLSAIITAAYQGQRPIIDILVAAGAERGIHEAVVSGDLDYVQTLVQEWQGYTNLVSKDGFTPLQLACFFNQEAIALWLIAQGADVQAVAQNDLHIQPLHAVVTNGNLTIVRALLTQGADVNARQQNAFTPLHTAAAAGNVALVELLLAHGADKTAQDGDGRIPYDHAQLSEQTAVYALLQP